MSETTIKSRIRLAKLTRSLVNWCIVSRGAEEGAWLSARASWQPACRENQRGVANGDQVDFSDDTFAFHSDFERMRKTEAQIWLDYDYYDYNISITVFSFIIEAKQLSSQDPEYVSSIWDHIGFHCFRLRTRQFCCDGVLIRLTFRSFWSITS